MLQRLLIITLTLCSLTASAQWQQTGAKVRYVNGLGIPTKDTAAGVAADSSQILIRPADSSLYIKYKRTWVKVGAGGGGTIGGSGTTNYVPKFTAGTTLGNSVIFATDSVGIGTITPLEKLHVIGRVQSSVATSGAAYFLASNTSGGTTFGNDGIGGYILTNWNAPLLFYTNGTNERMRITSAGNVGIGYTTPAAKLAVSGTTLINTNTDNGVDKLQVSGNTISTRYKVNTSGQTTEINNYYNGGLGKNLWIGGGGASSTSASERNVSIGVDALLNNTSGYFNVGLGSESLRNNTSGFRNMAVGFQALFAITSGSRNVGIGNESLGSNTTGTNNVAIGTSSLLLSTTSGDNIAIGNESLREITTGASNVGFGTDAGRYISGGTSNQTSSQSIYIGQDTRSSADGNTNEMVLGHNTIGQGSNTVTLGNSSITKTFLRGNTMINTTTDNGVDELQVNGSISGIGFKQAYVTKTGAYTATNDDYVIDCTSGTFTVTLPASSGRTGRILIIKNSGAGTITVDGNASETIDGAATYSLAVQYATIQIVSDGTNWKIIAKF